MRRPVLFIIMAVAALAVVKAHAADELERYLASVARERVDVDITSADSLFSGKGLSQVEGLWRISGSEGVMAVIADPATIFYRIVAVDSPDRSVCPGTVMGAMTAAGRTGHYDARMFTGCDDGVLSNAKRFTVSVNDDGRLIIVPVINKLKVNLWRFLPYMFRASVTRVNDRPNNLDGAIRLYPEPTEYPLSPRYL